MADSLIVRFDDEINLHRWHLPACRPAQTEPIGCPGLGRKARSAGAVHPEGPTDLPTSNQVRPHHLAVIVAGSPRSHTEGCRLHGPDLPVTTLLGRCPADVSTTTRRARRA